MDYPFTMDYLLAHACPSHEVEDGWWEYGIELCCISFRVVARKVRDGLWDDSTGNMIAAPEYVIKHYESV